MADQFSLIATGNTTDINVVLTGTLSGAPGVFYITGLTGTVDGQSATLLATSGPGVVTNSSVVNNWSILINPTSTFGVWG